MNTKDEEIAQLKTTIAELRAYRDESAMQSAADYLRKETKIRDVVKRFAAELDELT